MRHSETIPHTRRVGSLRAARHRLPSSLPAWLTLPNSRGTEFASICAGPQALMGAEPRVPIRQGRAGSEVDHGISVIKAGRRTVRKWPPLRAEVGPVPAMAMLLQIRLMCAVALPR